MQGISNPTESSPLNQRLQRGTSRGIIDPRRIFQSFSLRCYEPVSPLKPFVDHFWIVRWSKSLGMRPSLDYLLTQPAFTVSLSRYNPYVRGITTQKVPFALSGNGVEVGMKFTPGGLYSFWPYDMSKLANRQTLISKVFPEVSERYLEALYAVDDDAHFVAAMEELLLKRLPKTVGQRRLISNIITMIHNEERMTVTQVAANSGLSERTLQHLFATQVGAGVKWPIMRTRLIQSMQKVHATQKPNWARMAAELGYSTQSHFINDFKRHLGLPPSAFQTSLDRDGELPSL